jgi:UDP-N-acetylglucosamine:LPS N-acetylglucosamine transferase
VLASVDAVLTKPGYGTFAEAACAGVPVLYVSRGEWPEQPYLVNWLRQHGVCREVANDRLLGGNLSEELQQLWSQPMPEVPSAHGAVEAATILARYL